MYRKFAKGAVLISVVGLTFYLCRANTLIACIAATYMLMHSIVSLDREKALRGDDKDPGLLMISSISLPLGSPVLLVGVPYIFHETGLYDSWSFDWLSVIAALMAGLILAAYLWIPFLLYALIDLLFNRFAVWRTSVL